MKKTMFSSRITLMIFCLFISKTLSAQDYAQVIEDNTAADFVQHSIIDIGDEYVVAGTVVDPVSGGSDILLVWTDINGIISWSKYLDYGKDEFVGSLLLDADNQHIVLTGYTGSNGGDSPNKDLILVKLNYQGNLVMDVTIEDIEPGYGFSLYGTDIEQTDSGDYIVVGTGAFGADDSANKYGFVLRVSQDLARVVWGYRYESQGVGKQYDSFSHILKVKNSPHGEAYLLTGSGMDLSNDQMVTNDLIAPNGNSLWGGAIGRSEGGTYNNPGIKALYDDNNDRFHILYYGVENIPSLFTLDGSGHTLSGRILHNHNHPIANDNNNFLSGMAWGDAQKTEIVLSGYYIDPQAPKTGWPLLIRVFPNSFEWYIYDLPFEGNDLINVDFDYIVKPINYYNPSFPQMLNQIYYQPKALTKTDWDYVFLAPFQNQVGSPFGLSLLNADQKGHLGCMTTTYGFKKDATFNDYLNFVQWTHSFIIIEHNNVQIIDAYPDDFITCGKPMPRPKPLMDTSSIGTGIKILLFPNPAHEYLNISGLYEVKNPSISLYDMRGQEVISHVKAGNGNEVQLAISNLENGVYFVQVSSQGKVVFQKKLVKE